jgi:hypothetical protein
VTVEDVTATNGVFNVKIDFGSSVFSGGDVYLEIGVRRGAETGAFTPLNPRQQITSAPYAIRSLSATSVGAGTAGNSVVNAINDAATNVRINSNRLPADIVRIKPAVAQESTSEVGGGTDATVNLIGNYTHIFNGPVQNNFRINHDGTVLATGHYDAGALGTLPVEGAGTRMLWYPKKAAFRAGGINGTQWDDANIGLYSTAFGENVRALGDFSLAVGRNTVAANTGTVALGDGHTATGANSVALGYYASTSTSAGSPRLGTFVFSDRSVVDGTQFHAELTNAAHWRVANGFRIYTSSNRSTGVTFQNGATASNWGQANAVISSSTGAYLSTSGVWTNASSRDLKTNFAAVDTRSVLRKVLSLPIQTWNYKSDNANVRHIGAIAQDFRQAFNVGDTDVAIGTVDADGVALAAIQGLNEELKDELKARDAKIDGQKAKAERLETQIERQQKQIDELKQIVCSLKPDAAVCKDINK